MDLTDYKKDINELLNYNLYHVSKNMGLEAKKPPPIFTEKLLYQYLNLMEYYFLISKEYCFIIASLLWENHKYIQQDIRNEQKNQELIINLSSVLTNIFIKLGVPISAKTLQNNKQDSYEELGSFALELQRTYDIVTKHTVQFIEDKTLELNDFQKEIWEGLDYEYKTFSISAGTSTGKSFLLTHKIISWAYKSIIEKKQRFQAILIVPSIALINQNLIDLSSLLKEFPALNKKVKLYQHFTEMEENQSAIFIVTQERMRETIFDLDTQDTNIQNMFSSLSLLVCDEIQNIGISTTDDVSDTNTVYNQRADLYYSIFELIQKNSSINIQKIILAGANISNNDLQRKYKKLLNVENYTYFPKENKQYISPVTNIQLSLLKNTDDEKYYLTQDILLKTNEKLSIRAEVQKNKLFEAKWAYDKLKGEVFINKTFDMLSNINKNYPNMAVISYHRTPSMIHTSAKKLIKNHVKDEDTNDSLKSLYNSLTKYLPEDSRVVQISQYGIVLHHGQLPKEVRILLELAIKENIIKLVICNSTITQGVNLPIKFIIIPNKGLLSHKNELLNLKGRAGRLMQDLVGYILFLDITTFQTSSTDSSSLLDNATPEDMDTAEDYYQKTVDTNKDMINQILSTLKGIGHEKDLNPHIARGVIKIRQQLLLDMEINDIELYKNIDKKILQKNLDEMKNYHTHIGSLYILAQKHISIDPMDIYSLYNILPNISITYFNDSTKKWLNSNTHNTVDFKYYKNILEMYNQNFPYYVKQIMKVDDLKYIYGFCEKWMNGETYLLKEILETQQQYNNEKNSDKKFDEIKIFKSYTSEIPYDFVKLVAIVEDLYQYTHSIKTDWTSVLRYGTTNEKIISLMRLGIEREMAILIQRNTKNINTPSESIKYYYDNHADVWERKLLEKFNYI